MHRYDLVIEGVHCATKEALNIHIAAKAFGYEIPTHAVWGGKQLTVRFLHESLLIEIFQDMA